MLQFCNGINGHFCLQEVLNSLWLSWCDSAFHVWSYIFNERQICTAGTSVKNVPYRIECLINSSVEARTEWGQSFSCFSGKMSSWWQFMSLSNPNIYFPINDSSIQMQLTHAINIDALPNRNRCLLLHLLLIKCLDGTFVIETENLMSIFLKSKLKSGLSWAHHTFPLSWIIWDEFGPEKLGSCLYRIDK